MPLVLMDGGERPPKIFSAPRLYFDEHERISITADNVNLASASSSKIAVKNLVTISPEKPAGQLLTESATLDMLRFPGPKATQKTSPTEGDEVNQGVHFWGS